ncbi:MAG: prefoldin subunit alpha [Candidatus Thalassarchaeaceae archaeon]|jgi:prefoldin alpha subunit|nr:prefoldin subunit alpha [Candidatus Thalassarchaeaceae archaeon]|tara:strand:- start:1307 stop:1828 length:522 start_codon:yes stop_codon:yes gene_type:complete
MPTVDREELQRLAQLVEVNRERLETIDRQIRNLESIRLEQSHAMEALEGISEDGAKGIMLPLGAGVQLIADIPADAGAVVDMGSRVQAEKTRDEATSILKKRNDELIAIMETVKREYDELEGHVVSLANQFNEAVEGTQTDPPPTLTEEGEANAPKPRSRKRRKRGTELTLDD